MTDESRIVAACVHCGSAYAALELGNGERQPIGTRTGCARCDETEFVPFSDRADRTQASNTRSD